MAIDTLVGRTAVTDEPGIRARALECLTRAALTGRTRATESVVESAIELLCCDAAVMLRPTEYPQALSATLAVRDGAGTAHARWDLGPQAARVFERACQSSDGWREPWSALRLRLRDLEVRSWAAVPLHSERRTGPLGLLAIGARGEGRPCGRMHLLPDLALSAAATLAVAPEDGADGAPEHLRTVGNLAFGVSHALGNVFAAILGNAQLLRERASSDDIVELLGRIERSTAEGAELMRSMQAFTAGPVAAEMRALDLSRIADEVAGLVRRVCGHWPGLREVRVETDLAAIAPAWGDAGQLGECVVNLVFNALQVMGPEGRVLLRTAGDGRRSEIRVIDDGPGMTAEVRRRATEPFFTTHPALHQGLGLTVARGIAVAHRGTLTLHHACPRGTEVALRLPHDPPRPTARFARDVATVTQRKEHHR
ncbi:MAG: ATP-binding protein [Armatimonadota bacterium]